MAAAAAGSAGGAGGGAEGGGGAAAAANPPNAPSAANAASKSVTRQSAAYINFQMVMNYNKHRATNTARRQRVRGANVLPGALFFKKKG